MTKDSKPPALARIDAMPIALADLTVPELGEAFIRLDQIERDGEKISGICAVLKGLVLVEVKAKIGHGKFIPWMKEHFRKSPRSGNNYMRLAAEFSRQTANSKSASACGFELLNQDLAVS